MSSPKSKRIKNGLSPLSKKDIEHSDMATVTKKTSISRTFDVLGMDFFNVEKEMS